MMFSAAQLTPRQLARLINQAGMAPFAHDLLEVDEALWGGFWQGDVIAPGYTLPAVELALLRAAQLDGDWPAETGVAEFLADLHAAIRQPQAGVWTLRAAGEPCVVFAVVSSQLSVASCQLPVVGKQSLPVAGQRSPVSGPPSVTVVWYCATTGHLHAGYRAALGSLSFPGAVEQRPLKFSGASHLDSTYPPAWLVKTVEQNEALGGQPSAVGGPSLAARLDAEILRIRVRGYSTWS